MEYTEWSNWLLGVWSLPPPLDDVHGERLAGMGVALTREVPVYQHAVGYYLQLDGG